MSRDPQAQDHRAPHGARPEGPVRRSGCRPHRIFGFASASLTDVKRVKDHYGVKVNDVVVALAAAAVREHLQLHDELPDEPLVSQIPVSVRTEEERGTFGNQVSIMAVPVPTHLADRRGADLLRARGARLGQGAPQRPAGQGPARRDRVHPAGAAHPRGPRAGRAQRRALRAPALQPDHLQRPRPSDGHLQRRGPSRGAVPALDHRRRHRVERDDHELPRLGGHRHHRRPQQTPDVQTIADGMVEELADLVALCGPLEESSEPEASAVG